MGEIIELLRAEPVLFASIAGVLGLLVGSFLNVVIHRLPRMMEREWRADCAALDGAEAVSPPPYNLVTPRSACPACGALIRARDNVPVLSWLWLHGRCASCKAPISKRYPLVELATGLLSALVAWHFGWSLEALCGLGITWTLIALTAIDIDTQLLPDSMTLPLMWAGLLAAAAFGRGAAPIPVDLHSAVFGAIAGYLSLWLVYHAFRLATGKEGMGYGDFKLLAALGAWTGWQMLVPVLILSAGTGAVIGIALIVLRRRGREVPIPFGPYLAAAGWLVMMGAPRQLLPWWHIGP